ALLEEALRRNLFLVPLEAAPGDDASRPLEGPPGERGLVWYRYHRLFREALRQRLRARVGESAVDALHLRAGRWLAGRGFVDEAVAHSLAAGDATGAGALVERHVSQTLDREAWPAVRRWLDLLPEAEVRRRPALLLAQAWVVLLGGPSGVAPALLGAAEALSGTGAGDGDRGGAALGPELDALAASLRRRAGDHQGALAGAERALRGLPGERRHARGAAIRCLGAAAHLVEGAPAAVARLSRLLADADGPRDPDGL